MKPSASIEVCVTSHRRLLDGLAPLIDDDFLAPSLLPRLNRGHVVAHLTNKAMAHVVLFGGPAADEIRQLHPVGYDADVAAIAGASRSANELRTDLERAFELLQASWDALEEEMWDGLGVMTAGPRTMTQIIAHHLRNVEVHHVDLDIGYQVSDWPTLFVEGELAKRFSTLPNRADHADLLAWLLDRASAPVLAPW